MSDQLLCPFFYYFGLFLCKIDVQCLRVFRELVLYTCVIKNLPVISPLSFNFLLFCDATLSVYAFEFINFILFLILDFPILRLFLL